ncbi:hypothetical protein CRYUN_Cryun10bG0092200 [Craigia yunnanensis]
MGSGCPMSVVRSLAVLGFCVSIICSAFEKVIHQRKFVVESSPYSPLCSNKEILTVNGEFPGPTLKACRGDKMIMEVYNKARYSITLHWHGLKQERNPRSDGPEYITHCPIQPGKKFTYRFWKLNRDAFEKKEPLTMRSSMCNLLKKNSKE